MSAPVRALVVAKAPVAGRAKTRLGVAVGHERAAELASAALLDTVEACAAAYGAQRCHLALDGDLSTAVGGEALMAATRGWSVHPQRGDGFDERLAAAHADVAGTGVGPVVQVGMDTPQVTPELLTDVVAGLADHDAVLGPAEDGGWWALALRDPREASALLGIGMSTDRTYADTAAALRHRGLSVGAATVLRDVDEIADAQIVAALAPGTRFARLWSRDRNEVPA